MIWRVRDRATFRAFRRAPRVRNAHLEVRVVDCADVSAPPRVAYAVQRRVGSAVRRNQVRRRLRAAAQHHIDHLEPGRAYLVIAAPSAADADYAVLETALGDLVGKVRR